MRSKILIIGGSGLVGSTLLQYGIQNYDIHVTINRSKVELQHVSSSQIDLLTDSSKIIELITSMKPIAVINTAAYSSVDFCETNPELSTLLHVDVPRNIALACKNVGAKLIQFSTDAVFDGMKDRKYTEEDLPNPINQYGESRLSGEKEVMEISKENVVLRTAVIYGWHKQSRFTNWIINTLQEKKMVDPFVDQFNTPTLVDDLVQSIFKIIELNISGLYNAVGKTCLSRYDFAFRLADKFGLDKNLIKGVTSLEKRQKAPRPPKTCLDAQKLEKIIKFDFCSIDDGISFIVKKARMN
jgi:dTDP-4-dehydrorhamnose reductase